MLPDGESNPGPRVTGGDTYHYTIEECGIKIGFVNCQTLSQDSFSRKDLLSAHYSRFSIADYDSHKTRDVDVDKSYQ